MKNQTFFSTLIIASFFCIKNYSQNIKNSKYEKAIFESQRIIDSLLQKDKVPGIDIAISIDREIVWSKDVPAINLNLGEQRGKAQWWIND